MISQTLGSGVLIQLLYRLIVRSLHILLWRDYFSQVKGELNIGFLDFYLV